jgi:uncharacterized protein (DUF3820 family)
LEIKEKVEVRIEIASEHPILISVFAIQNMEQDSKQLIKLAHTTMPFGKYEGRYLIDLPEYYVVWYSNKGFPKGQLGQQLQLIYELKINGLEELIRNIKKKYPKPQ